MEIKRVAVIGCGRMGSGIGAMAALAGKETVLAARSAGSAAAGRERALACIRLREENGLHTKAEAARAEGLLRVAAGVEEAVAGADLVIESIVEDLEEKRALFERLDAILDPRVSLCSNTSGLRITDIAARCRHKARTLTTHFWLPAHLVPLVEVVLGDGSDEAMGKAVVSELKTWKKAPVLVRRDLPGQLANRVFQAIIREAVAIVSSGLASAGDVDTAIRCGMAMRFPEWGPLMHLDAIGLDLGLAVQDTVLPGISAEREANPYLRELVVSGNLGASTGKGFYDWESRDIRRATEKRDRFLIEAVKLTDRLDREDGSGAPGGDG